MGKFFAKSHTLLNKITTFIFMITLSRGTSKGRTFINSVIDRLNLMDKGIKIGFKVLLYISVILILFAIKKWILG
jgi:hypothetical protein